NIFEKLLKSISLIYFYKNEYLPNLEILNVKNSIKIHGNILISFMRLSKNGIDLPKMEDLHTNIDENYIISSASISHLNKENILFLNDYQIQNLNLGNFKDNSFIKMDISIVLDDQICTFYSIN